MREIFQSEFRKILITGGCGFIGSALVKKLIDYGATVLVIDNLKTGNDKFLPNSRKVKFVRADISVQGKWLHTIHQFSPELIYHLAAIHFIPYCELHWDETILTNLLGTYNILKAANNLTVKGIIFASSAAVYPVSEFPHRESDALGPIDIYGLTKKWAEELLYLWSTKNKIPVRVARLFNVYGYNETNPHLIPEIIYQKKNGNSILKVGNLHPRRDYIFIEDVIEAFIIITKTLISKKDEVFDIYNVGTGSSSSVKDVIKTLSEIIGREIKFTSISSKKRKVDRDNLQANIDKLKQLGWKPKYSLYKGLKKYWGKPGDLKWFKTNRKKLMGDDY